MKTVKHFSNDMFEMIAGRFKVLSDPMRLQILHHLQIEQEANVTQISLTLNTSQPNISKHLKILQNAGLLARRQEGNTVFYSIADQSIFEMCDAVCQTLKTQIEEKLNMLSSAA